MTDLKFDLGLDRGFDRGLMCKGGSNEITEQKQTTRTTLHTGMTDRI